MKKILAMLALSLSVCYGAHAQYENTTVKVGMKAPELAYPNPDGKVLKLSEINKGRYVLVDFWASWCGPCRNANPGLVKMYDNYSKKKIKGAKNGFTVLSVSLDANKASWVAAIQKDYLSWPYQISDLKQWHSDAAKLYGIEFIPQAFLVDPSGKVVSWYMTAEQANGDLQKLVVE